METLAIEDAKLPCQLQAASCLLNSLAHNACAFVERHLSGTVEPSAKQFAIHQFNQIRSHVRPFWSHHHRSQPQLSGSVSAQPLRSILSRLKGKPAARACFRKMYLSKWQ
jgi:hypothetical protein